MINIKNKILKIVLLVLMFVTIITAFRIIKGMVGGMKRGLDNSFSGEDLGEGNKIQQKNPDELLFVFAGVDDDGSKTNTRTDTLMLVLMNKKNKTIDIISIPRDTRVYIEGDLDKINAAHSYGGIDETIKTIRTFLNIDLDYYMQVSFQSVVDIIDAMGGVDINVSEDIADAMEIDSGIHKFNGEEALAYVRFRKGYANADIGRISTQQDFMVQLIKQMLKPKNIIKLPKIYSKTSSKIDTNISNGTLLSFAFAFRSISKAEINTYTIPGEGEMIDGISYYVAYEQKTIDLRNQILYNYIMD